MALPLTSVEALKCITTETARMSYPASMSRGKKPVVAKHTKKLVETHLLARFPISDVWNSKSSAFTDFETWHAERINAMAPAIEHKVLSGNEPKAVAAKFINTFLHQLTKYEAARPLLPHLHLPLDRRVFDKLRTLKSPALSSFKQELKGSPYSLAYAQHLGIQAALLKLLNELNDRNGATYRFSARIELNWLWL
jgi:hypothetical protein